MTLVSAILLNQSCATDDSAERGLTQFVERNANTVGSKKHLDFQIKHEGSLRLQAVNLQIFAP